MTERESGMVYLVGAGPGDPGLLTRRGGEVLARAELVVYDGLVNPALLSLAPPTAERRAVGRQEGVRLLPQSDVNRLLVEAARAGRTVVRLKGGDPCVFGRGGEEAVELAAAGLPFEIVPGVSSFHAAPACGGIPLPDSGPNPGAASQFVVLSGHEDPAKAGADIDWVALGRFPGPKVILMGMERLAGITRDLIAGGADASEPAALIRCGTTPQQASLVGTLGDIAARASHAAFAAPAVVVIGNAVRHAATLAWFERRPLFGRRIVLTRARGDSGSLGLECAGLGAEVWEVPAIRRAAPQDPLPAAQAIEQVSAYEWLVFTSPAGVTAFLDQVMQVHGDIRALGNARIAAVGPGTAARLREVHLRVDAMPARFLGREIARAMEDQGNLRDLRVLLARAEVGGADLVTELEKLGALVDDVGFYRTLPESGAGSDPEGLAQRLQAEGADWITFTSGSTVEGIHARLDLPALCRAHPRLRLASIGPETTRTLKALGLTPAAEADPHTPEGLLDAILRAR